MTLLAADRCPTCRVTYRAFRCGYTIQKGAVATPNRVKAECWAMHLEACDAFDVDAVSFDVVAFDARPDATHALSLTCLTRLPSVPVAGDEWGGEDPEADAFERDWAWREAEARAVLGVDYGRAVAA